MVREHAISSGDASRVRFVRPVRSGFSLIDILVTIAIVALLIGIAMPAMSHVRESARRVVCGSNIRQSGLALSLWADDHRGFLPPSVFLDIGNKDGAQRQDMMTVRLSPSDSPPVPAERNGWDGLGLLYSGDYLPASSVYYCPSHTGEHPIERYAQRWVAPEPATIVSNYQFRGSGPNLELRLFRINPAAALLTDGLRTIDDFNHEVGINVLSAGLAAAWLPDEGGVINSMLIKGDGGDGGDQSISAVWSVIDNGFGQHGTRP